MLHRPWATPPRLRLGKLSCSVKRSSPLVRPRMGLAEILVMEPMLVSFHPYYLIVSTVLHNAHVRPNDMKAPAGSELDELMAEGGLLSTFACEGVVNKCI